MLRYELVLPAGTGASDQVEVVARFGKFVEAESGLDALHDFVEDEQL